MGSSDNPQKIQKLLALKRYETPPLGYFRFLPDKVIARIESERLQPTLPWWERWFSGALPRTAFAGVCGLCAGAAAFLAIGFAQFESNAGIAAADSMPAAVALAAAIPITPARTAHHLPPSIPVAHAVLVGAGDTEGSVRPVYLSSSPLAAGLRSDLVQPAVFRP
jgi:hypothetical protein